MAGTRPEAKDAVKGERSEPRQRACPLTAAEAQGTRFFL